MTSVLGIQPSGREATGPRSRVAPQHENELASHRVGDPTYTATSVGTPDPIATLPRLRQRVKPYAWLTNRIRIHQLDTIESRLVDSAVGYGANTMADPVWFYARGDVERGPFTLPQIRALANASKLRPDDLVWKEGMENWTAAREVAELFPTAGLIGDQSGSNGMGIAVESRSVSTQSAAKATLEVSHEVRAAFHRTARALTLVGVVLIVGTSGCENLSERRVTRLAAIAEMGATPDAASETRTAASKAALDHQASAFARGVAMQMGLVVLLAGAAGLLILADRYERWLAVGIILIVVFSAVRELGEAS